MLNNGQTYFKSLAVWTPQDFKSMFGHFLTLCMKRLIYFNMVFISSSIRRLEIEFCVKKTLWKLQESFVRLALKIFRFKFHY